MTAFESAYAEFVYIRMTIFCHRVFLKAVFKRVDKLYDVLRWGNGVNRKSLIRLDSNSCEFMGVVNKMSVN